MRLLKKLKLSENEIDNMMNQMGGYVWLAIDAKRGVISTGDDYIADMRDDLIGRRSKREDIYGLGLDLSTGEIDYLASINRRNPSTDHGRINDEQIIRIETLLRYFFENTPCFKAEHARPRYSKKPQENMAKV